MFFFKGNPTKTETTLHTSKASSAHEQTIVHSQVTAADVMIPSSPPLQPVVSFGRVVLETKM